MVIGANPIELNLHCQSAIFVYSILQLIFQINYLIKFKISFIQTGGFIKIVENGTEWNESSKWTKTNYQRCVNIAIGQSEKRIHIN